MGNDECGHPLDDAAVFWDEVVADVAATAEQYREAGWETIVLHPGDVAVLADDADDFGLDVSIPDDEFETVEKLLDGGAMFDSYEVYRSTRSGKVFLLVALEDIDGERAVLYPAYYEIRAANGMVRRASEAGAMYTHLRRLSGERVTVRHEEPDVFFPDELRS